MEQKKIINTIEENKIKNLFLSFYPNIPFPFPYLLLILPFFISKKVIILNEETLVAVSFLTFVFFIFKFYGKSIQEFFNEKVFAIKSELKKVSVKSFFFLYQSMNKNKKIVNFKTGLTLFNQLTVNQLLIDIIKGKSFLYLLLTDRVNKVIKNISLLKPPVIKNFIQFLPFRILESACLDLPK